MKKTDLDKNQGLAIAHRLKNSAKAKLAKKDQVQAGKKKLIKQNPLLASLIKKN